MQMTVREFVLSSMKKSDSPLGGIQGYTMMKPVTKLDKPLDVMIRPGKKKTFVDDEVKLKSFVPEAKYNVSIDWTRNTRSNFNKDRRHTLASDIERKAQRVPIPEPTTYSLNHRLVEPKVTGALNLKAKKTDTSFLADPIFKGSNSPRFYEPKHSLVEKRVTTLGFYKPINTELDAQPSFLRARKATHMVSPASHNPLESLKVAVLPNQRFYMRKGSPKTFEEIEIKRTKNNPGVGHYDIKNINKAYDKITLGASKGWK